MSVEPVAPLRTCLGCRQRDSRSRLLRVVAGEVTPRGVAIIPDPAATAPGRGCWLHHDFACLSQALKRRSFGRALRMQSTIDTSAVEAWPTVRMTRPIVEQ